MTYFSIILNLTKANTDQTAFVIKKIVWVHTIKNNIILHSEEFQMYHATKHIFS